MQSLWKIFFIYWFLFKNKTAIHKRATPGEEKHRGLGILSCIRARALSSPAPLSVSQPDHCRGYRAPRHWKSWRCNRTTERRKSVGMGVLYAEYWSNGKRNYWKWADLHLTTIKNLTKQYFCVILVKIQFEVLLWTHIFSKILIWIWIGLHRMIIIHQWVGLYLYIHFGIDNIIFPYVYNGVSCCRNLHRLFLYHFI